VANITELSMQRMRLTDQIFWQATWPGPNSTSAKALSALRSLQVLDLSQNAFCSLDVSSLNSLTFLNVSGNPDLRQMQLPPDKVLDALDASKTSVPLALALCGYPQFTFSGARVVLLQNLAKAPPQQEAFAALRFCLAMPVVVDLSQNAWLTNVEELNGPHHKAPFFALGDTRSDLVLSGSPLQCSWQRSFIASRDEYAKEGPYSVYTEKDVPIIRLSCRCSPGYENMRGICRLKVPWIAETGHLAVVVVLAMLALAPVLIWLIMRARRRLRVTSGDLELKQRLLDGAEHELASMRLAWEIDRDDVQLEECLASGAYGKVWRGRYDAMTVAIKVLHAHLLGMEDLGGSSAFEQEVVFLQRVRNPHLVRFWGAGTLDSGAPFLVLEYIANGSLRSFLREASDSADDTSPPGALQGWQADEGNAQRTAAGSLARGQAVPRTLRLRFASHIAIGMAYIHERGHMHRDLKTDNVLLTSDLRAKVTDFGTVRLWRLASDGRHVAHHTAGEGHADSAAQSQVCSDATTGVGTPPYMSPEVLLAEPYGTSADVWSYGCILWELVTRRRPELLGELGIPHSGPYRQQLAKQLLEGKRLSLGDDEAKELESTYADLMRSCWLAEPEQRPAFEEARRLLAFLQRDGAPSGQ
jgi:hypothetical protein